MVAHLFDASRYSVPSRSPRPADTAAVRVTGRFGAAAVTRGGQFGAEP
jgi:hypothetical protein